MRNSIGVAERCYPASGVSRPVRPSARFRAAAAAIILLALAACGTAATTSATNTGATAIPSGGPGTLTGTGSTYVAPFFARYHQQHPSVTVNYSPVGSSAGISAISAKEVTFGASDVPMNASELAAQGGPITQVPDAHDGQAYAGANLYVPLPAPGPATRPHNPPEGHRPHRDTC